jgi:hypothetical protein
MAYFAIISLDIYYIFSYQNTESNGMMRNAGVSWAMAGVVWLGHEEGCLRCMPGVGAEVSMPCESPTGGSPVYRVAPLRLHTDDTALRSRRTQAGARVGRARRAGYGVMMTAAGFFTLLSHRYETA